MPLATVNSLVDALRSRPILRPDQVREVEMKYAPAHADTQELARTLIRLRWITIYQAKKLVVGKADELVVGQYVILDKLGEGGMGRVYKAMQLSLNRPVALKVVRQSLLKNETALKRFRREVRSAAQLSHPNIVRVFDADQVGDRHFLAMEFIDGVDLGKLVKDRGPLPIPMACSYIRQAALGLQHAHDRQMVHRDIKPANLLVAAGDKGEYGVRNPVKILDMGLARFQDDGASSTEVTRAGTVVGTPDYMSPEQAKDSSNVDHRSDLYSLGCTLFFLLAGEPPFPKGNPVEKLLQHQLDPPPPVQSSRPDVPNELAAIIHCLLAKRPDDRFQSGAALAHALEPWCSAGAAAAAAPTMVLPAEAVDADSVVLEADPNDPFDFAGEGGASGPRPARRSGALSRTLAGPATRRWWVLGLAALFVVFLVIGGIIVGVLASGRKKLQDPPSPGTHELPRTEPAKIAPKARAEVSPARDLEAVDKYLPNDTAVAAVFNIKALQASPAAKRVILGPVADELLPFRAATGIDLTALVERAVIGVGPEEKGGALVILQGRALVTPGLTDALRAQAGANVVAGWDGGPDLFGIGPTFLATTETCLLVSARPDQVVEALQKQDGSRTTAFTDPTVARGLEELNRPRVQEAFFARSAAVRVVAGLRQRWQKDHPAAAKLNSLAGLLAFDDHGMHLHVLADEDEPGAARDFLRVFGRALADLSKTHSDQRLERIGRLVADAEPVKLPVGRAGLAHLRATVPNFWLNTWLVPFERAQ